MGMQLKHVTKEELHKMIDEIPEEKLMVLTYKKDIGISDNGKMLKKKKTKKLVDKATLLIMTESNPIRKVDLEGNFGLFDINRENMVKTILFPQLEWSLINRTYNIFTIISNWQTQTYVLYLFLQKEKAYRFIGVGASPQ